MSNFFIELYSEEIPFAITKCLVDEVKKSFKHIFSNFKIIKNIDNDDFCQIYVTPCRIVFFTDSLYEEVTIDKKEIVGPKIDDEKGILNFLNAFKVSSVNELLKRDGYYVFIKKDIKLKVKDIIEQNIHEFLNNIHSRFIQNTNWNSCSNYWFSPLRSIICFVDNKLLNFNYCCVQSSNLTFGHKTLIGFEKKIAVNDFEDYKIKMKNNFVLIDQKERQDTINSQIRKIEIDNDLSVLKNYLTDYDDIIKEIVYTTEFPSVYVGEFKKEYLKLPNLILKEIIFKEYNSICLKNDNNILSNKFILFSNTKTTNNGKYIISGIERTINSRLSFIDLELTKYLSENLDIKLNKLKIVTYAKDFGNIFDHVERTMGLSKFLCLWLPHCDLIMSEDAAKLSKIDYTTNLIKIHPELKGFLSSYYAKLNNYSKEVCDALEEQYKPKESCDKIPSTDIGKVLAISDRIDNITSLFIKNRECTSSNDPYGLRKSISIVIKIIIDGNMGIPLGLLLHKSISLFGTNIYKDNKNTKISVKNRISEVQKNMISLFEKRFYNFVESRGYNIKIINAVKNTNDVNLKESSYKINLIYKKIIDVSQYKENNDKKFNAIKNTYKRLKNILYDFNTSDSNKLFKKIFRTFSIKKIDDQDLNEKITNIKRELKIARKSNSNIVYMDLLYEFNEILEDYFKDHLIRTDNVKETNRRLFLMLKIKKLFDIFLDFSSL